MVKIILETIFKTRIKDLEARENEIELRLHNAMHEKFNRLNQIHPELIKKIVEAINEYQLVK